MPDELEHVGNTDRLVAHLEEGALSARLVRARQAAEGGDDAVAKLNKVLADRLEETRAKLDGAAD